jgi:DNA-binding response OmpR family regulator
MFRPVTEARGLDLSVKVDPSDVVEADRESWTRVVMNLLSNAVKFTQQGDVSVSLRFEKDEGGDQIAVLDVSDTGSGIPPSEQFEVFELFRQGENRAVRGEPGSGIGLALVQEIVDTNHGSIALASEPGVGTHVTVRIPAPPAPGPAEVEHPQMHRLAEQHLRTLATRTSRPNAETSSATGTARGRVLLVEDDEDLRHYLVRLLRNQGYEVFAAADAETALEEIPSQDLIVADLMLPGMSGIDLVRRVRGTADAATVPIILLTAKSGSDSLIEGLGAGADDYVTKPFHPTELLARVRSQIDLGQLRRLAIEQVEERAGNLMIALETNRRIGVAVGILQALQRITPEAAFHLLREVSQRQNRKLREVAEDVIEYGTFDVTPPSRNGVRTS